MTLPRARQALYEATRMNAALYIACGIDPAKATIFVQSHVTARLSLNLFAAPPPLPLPPLSPSASQQRRAPLQAHSELAWLLNCVTPIGWLNRMIQARPASLFPCRASPRAPPSGPVHTASALTPAPLPPPAVTRRRRSSRRRPGSRGRT